MFQELRLKQKKKEICETALLHCIEDPEEPVGSGGATLNGLLAAVELLSASSKNKVSRPFARQSALFTRP
jgi:hypothetical protein